MTGLAALAFVLCIPARGAEPALAERTRAEVVRALAESPGPWTSVDGDCLDLAARWFERLAAAGLPVRMVTVDPSLAAGTALVDGRPARAGKFHAFVAVGEGSGEVIVDAAWRQFFADPSGLPGVLVATREEAVRAFASRSGSLRVELYDDPFAGRYEPGSFATLVYGFGPNGALRVVL